MARLKVQYITDPKQWEVLVSPARLEVVEGLRCVAPCSIRELAELLDRPGDSLYRHIELLVEAGIVVEAGYRKNGKHMERIVDLTADDYQINFKDGAGTLECKVLTDTIAVYSRAATRCAEKSAEAGQFDLTPGRRNLAIDYQLTWLDEKDFAKARDLLHELRELCNEGRRKREGRLYVTFVTYLPVTRKRHAKERQGPKTGEAPKASANGKSSRKSRA